MKKTMIFIGILILIGIGYLIKLDFDKYRIINEGELIEVYIKSIPISCKLRNRSIKAYFKFVYEGKTYSKNLKDKYCKLVKIDNTIKLITNKSKSVFLYPDENIKRNHISLGLLFLIFSYFIFRFVKKKALT